jgi:hypothetical protein
MLAILLSLLLQVAFGYRAEIPSGQRLCFWEQLSTERMSLNFHQPSATKTGNSDLVLSITGPSNELLKDNVPEGPFSLIPELPGRYVYCFMNKSNSGKPLEVEFFLSGAKEIPAGDSGRIKNSAHGNLDAMLRDLASSLRVVASNQDFMQKHVKSHLKIANMTQHLVVVWPLLQIVMAALVGYLLIRSIKRIFERPMRLI